MSVKGRVSIIIPARNERYLSVTVDGLLQNARGDVEILVMLDGLTEILIERAVKERQSAGKPEKLTVDEIAELREQARTQPSAQELELPRDERVRVIRRVDKPGMRGAINQAAELATGEFLLKCDGHIRVDPAYDEILKFDCDERTLVVPTRHSINPETWETIPKHFNYSTITFPFSRSEYGQGMHAVTYPQRANRAINEARKHLLVDDIIGAQGSFWFQRRDYFRSFGPLDEATFGFWQESQEVMFRIWLSGGRCVVSKKTAYSHLHKGREYRGADGRVGRGYFVSLKAKDDAEAAIVNLCLTNSWPKQTRTFESLVEQFWPFIEHMNQAEAHLPEAQRKFSWPDDWRDWEKHRALFVGRPPEAIPPHLERGARA